MLPTNFPNCTNVYASFRRWVRDGVMEKMYDRLQQMWLSRQEREPEPWSSVLDSQSVKTSPQGGPHGYDGAKRLVGRKRHLLVDTVGLLLAVLITPAGMSAAAAAVGVQLQVFKRPSQPKQGWSTAGELPLWPVKPAAVHGPLPILAKHWIVGRNNAWSDRPRRMNRDHDRLMSVSESWIWLTQGRMLPAKWTASKEA